MRAMLIVFATAAAIGACAETPRDDMSAVTYVDVIVADAGHQR